MPPLHPPDTAGIASSRNSPVTPHPPCPKGGGRPCRSQHPQDGEHLTTQVRSKPCPAQQQGGIAGLETLLLIDDPVFQGKQKAAVDANQQVPGCPLAQMKRHGHKQNKEEKVAPLCPPRLHATCPGLRLSGSAPAPPGGPPLGRTLPLPGHSPRTLTLQPQGTDGPTHDRLACFCISHLPFKGGGQRFSLPGTPRSPAGTEPAFKGLQHPAPSSSRG